MKECLSDILSVLRVLISAFRHRNTSFVRSAREVFIACFDGVLYN